MICPAAYHVETEHVHKEEPEEAWQNKSIKMPVEGTGSLELNSYKNSKTWKKSISNFFRNQLRSTKSNDGGMPSGSKNQYEDKEINPEQKWQSLGKIFRRQGLQKWSKSTKQQGECSSPNKRLAVKQVLSSYFGKKTFANDN